MKTKAYVPYVIIGLCVLFLAVAFFTGCQAKIYKKVWSLSVSGDVHTVGSMNVFTHDEKHIAFTLKACPGGTFPTGLLDNFQATARPFWIARTEVTYELWYTVYTWAKENGYTFAYPGREGSSGQAGSAPTAAGLQPVTDISWRDMIIWCNALTEYYNEGNGSEPDLTCVYFTDKDFTRPLRNCNTDQKILWDNGPGPCDGSQDDPCVNENADGFRLPLAYEWECAARYIEDKNRDGDIMDPGEYYPGTFPSGFNPDAAEGQTLHDAAWWYQNSSNTTHEVGQKPVNGNGLGCYDMSGNVYEMCFDDLPFFSNTRIQKNHHATRGGCFYSYLDSEIATGVFSRRRPPCDTLTSMGFRPVRNP
jgi:formylglycine-generating enzyme required for sulfatase activity